MHSPNRARSPSPVRGRSPSPKSMRLRNHSPTARHVDPDVVTDTLRDIGVESSDIREINEIVSGLPSRTRKIKENTFSTIINLNEKWKQHKARTAELLKESKRRDQQHREKITKLQTNLQKVTLENERLKVDISRMEGLVNELQNIKYEQSKERKEKEELLMENRRLRGEIDCLSQSKAKYQERVRVLENDKSKVDSDNARLRVAFRRQEDRANLLERDLRETKVELEMFEEMLSNVPLTDGSTNDISGLDPPSPVTKPSASRAVASGIAGASKPIYSSTPLARVKPKSKLGDRLSQVENKVSMTTGLMQLANEHRHGEVLCREMAEQAAELKMRSEEMKERDHQISKLLDKSLDE